MQQNPKAQSFFCEVFGEDLNEGKSHLWAQESNTHKCHLIAISYKSMAVRTVLAYELSSKKEPMQREDGLDKVTNDQYFCNVWQCMSSLYASKARNSMIRTSIEKMLKRKLKHARRNSPCTPAAKTYKLTRQNMASVYIWLYNLIRSQHLQARVLEKTSASHLHLADLRNWGGAASAASDTSLTCPVTSWRHQDVKVEEWKSKEWV